MLWFKYYLDIFPLLENWDPPTQDCLGNIRSTVLFQLGEGMKGLFNRKVFGIMPAVYNHQKGNNWVSIYFNHYS